MSDRVFHIVRCLRDGSTYLLGVAVSREPGQWRFLPNVSGKSPSRKYHPTFEKCLPRWVGYPDSCESFEVKR
jgi:hypothetical protein